MAISYKNIKSSRQWSATAGMKEDKFMELSSHFEKAYVGIFGMEMHERQKNSTNKKIHFRTYKDLLFFILFSIKSGLTYDALGLVFGMTGSNAKAIQTFGLKILKITLRNISMAPAREFPGAAEFKKLIPSDEPIIVDGTEHRTQRPKDKEVRKERSSGKKKISR